MELDIGNALDSVATPGVSRDSLERLDERVAEAHDRIETRIDEREHGYAALALPETADPDAIRAAVDPIDCDTLLVVGIGGSALGAATLADALELDIDLYTLDNVDPEHTRELLDSLDLSRTALHVVSRSGTTAETLANFLVAREAMDSVGVDWTDRTLVTTGEEGNLRGLAERHDLPVLDVPAGVPGRFSALSTVALPAAALGGGDVEALLAGARSEAEGVAGSLFETPAYAYGATAYALAERGWRVNAMMPYAESLETFAEWFAQLWAESLGKDGVGQLPARALGATDQHSQLQLYRAGPRNAMVSLVRPRERADVTIPETDLEGLSYLGGSSLGELLDAEFESTEESLAAAGRPNLRIEIERVDAHELGGLLYGMEAACVLAGELFSVSTFTQPAVEWGKNAARGLLGGGEFEEARAVEEKTRLVID
ncbi:glucose-6-phosphate isomerase [Halalkalicoccus subterraneus]|uniref:glucose-6-phosphate isomerase n=1 Tax=Halalkalicoccus subterraneus TaxID=2675002 RepID=UPI000EFAFC37|nr:glucose-6-phosphate isomerase [Halalkalicoccus subterraneus]